MCKGCDPQCDICSTVDTSKCLQCKTGLYLLNTTCFKSCPDGYAVDTTQAYCFMIIPNNTNNNTGNGSGGRNTTIYVGYENGNLSTYVYFPLSITQAILGGVAAGSFFKDRSSLWHSNAIGLWGPLEFVAYGAQIYLAYDQLNKQIKHENVTSNSTNATSNSSTAINKTTTTQKRMLD